MLQWGNSDFGMDGDKRFLRISSGGISEDTPAIHVGQETIALSVSIDSRGLVWCVGQDRVMGRGSRKLNSVPVRSTLRIFSEGRDLLIERLEVLGFMDPITDAMTPFVSADCFSRPDDITMRRQVYGVILTVIIILTGAGREESIHWGYWPMTAPKTHG